MGLNPDYHLKAFLLYIPARSVSGRPRVPRSKEEREPMLKNCLLISLLLEALLPLPFPPPPICPFPGPPASGEAPLRSSPPRTLFNSPQIPFKVGSCCLEPDPEEPMNDLNAEDPELLKQNKKI